MIRKADLRKMHPAGSYPGVEDHAALDLAMAIHRSESTHCVVSWDAQERAQDYFNTHGLAATLDEIVRLQGCEIEGATA